MRIIPSKSNSNAKGGMRVGAIGLGQETEIHCAYSDVDLLHAYLCPSICVNDSRDRISFSSAGSCIAMSFLQTSNIYLPPILLAHKRIS